MPRKLCLLFFLQLKPLLAQDSSFAPGLWAFHHKVYRLEGGKRHLLSSQELQEALGRGESIKEAPVAFLREIPLKAATPKKVPDLKALEDQYVGSSFVQVYWVEKGQLRPFPDWVSFQEHRASRKGVQARMQYLEMDLLAKLPKGSPMPSVWTPKAPLPEKPIHAPALYKELRGKIVSYLDRLYLIQGKEKEGCERRPISPEDALRMGLQGPYRELSSQEAMLLPVGAFHGVEAP